MDVKILPCHSPFKIEGCFFPEVLFQAFPQKKRKKREMPSLREIRLFFSPIDGDNRFQASVKIVSEQDEKSERFCYSFALTSVGIFGWDGETPSDDEGRKKFEEHLAITGASILYSGLRTMLQTITAMGPHPPCILPPIRFVPEMIEKVEEVPFEDRDGTQEK